MSPSAPKPTPQEKSNHALNQSTADGQGAALGAPTEDLDLAGPRVLDQGTIADDVALPSCLLPNKNGRPSFALYGNDSGDWTVAGYELGWREQWTWEGAAGLYPKDERRNISVEGATEFHPGILAALREAASRYPELLDYKIQFDGPWVPLREALNKGTEHTPWSEIVFYHGTCESALDSIRKDGLKPRLESGVEPVYGATIASAKPAREDSVYLTTQEGMAKHAARQAAAKTHSRAVILEIRGVDGDALRGDDDSGETNPRRSLEVLGSVAHVGVVNASIVRVNSVLGPTGWEPAPEDPLLDGPTAPENEK